MDFFHTMDGIKESVQWAQEEFHKSITVPQEKMGEINSKIEMFVYNDAINRWFLANMLVGDLTKFTKYEIARILGARALQIAMDAPLLYKINKQKLEEIRYDPLRIAEISGQAAEMGILAVVQFMALISINLGLINLFPIPVLDGGHLLFYAYEVVRGRPLGERAQ